MAGEMNTINPGARVFSRMMSGLLSGDPEMIGMIQGKGAPSSLIRGFDDPAYANNPQWAVPAGYVPTAPTYSINPSGANTSAQHSALTRKAKGGEVQHFDEGGTSRLGRWWEGYKQRSQENLAVEDEIQKLQNEYYSLTVDPFKKTLSGQPEAAAQEQARIKQRINELKAAKADKSSGVSKAPTTIPGAGVMGSQAAADNMFGATYDPSQSLGYKGPPLKTVREPGEPGTYDQEKVRGIGDYAKELQDYLGPDKNLNLQRERLAKMEDRATRMEQDAPWLALTEAGFGAMAGTSPFALTNIGAGAQMGLKSYAAAKDKFAALEEKRLNLIMNMDQAERREKLAVAEFGAKSKEAAEERNFKRKLQKDLLDVKMAMNTDDNIKALMVAQEKNKPTVTEALKVQDYIAQNFPQE
jgi:hypothetical protein